MKYIKKNGTPEFFITDTSGLTKWSEYYSSKKRKLKKYILENEQSHVCCYCEKSITEERVSSHVKHIKPKSLDEESLTFEYSNILVSCEGNHFNEIDDNSKNTCGQIKGSDFNEGLFLNPTLINDISSYFTFDTDTGIISASDKNIEKADHTFQVLNLNGNNDKLAEARKITKKSIVKTLSLIPIENRKTKLLEYLSNDANEFITFLRYIYRNIK
jgi:uncharacterized protein (TIGR02646 family)